MSKVESHPGRHRKQIGYCETRSVSSVLRHHVVVDGILHDDELLARLSAADAVRWAAEAVDAHHRGELVAPARAHLRRRCCAGR